MNIFKGLGDSALSRITSLRKSAQQYQELSREDKGNYIVDPRGENDSVGKN